MLLTAPLLSKSSFLGSFISKCRQVIKPTTNKKNDLTTNNNYNLMPNTLKQSNDGTMPTASQLQTTSLPPPPPTLPFSTQSDTMQHNAPANIPMTHLLTMNNKINEKNFINTPEISRAPLAIKNVLSGVVTNGNQSIACNYGTQKSMIQTIEEKLGLPPRPKKPMTPYLRYLRDMRAKYVAENPKLSVREAIRNLSQQWHKEDPRIKKHFIEEYSTEQRQYVEIRTKYDAKLTEEQRAEIKKHKQEIVETKLRRQMRKRIKELGRPKRPSSAFFRFVKNERESSPQLPQQTFSDWHAKCAVKWARLPDAEKETYKAAARGEMETYYKERAAWEDKMIRLGNFDVVRQSSPIELADLKSKSNRPQRKQ